MRFDTHHGDDDRTCHGGTRENVAHGNDHQHRQHRSARLFSTGVYQVHWHRIEMDGHRNRQGPQVGAKL